MAEAVASISSYSSAVSVTLADVPRYRQTDRTLRSDFGAEYQGREGRRNPSPVDAATARTAIASAEKAGSDIIAQLQDIKDTIERAQAEGAVGPDVYVRESRQNEIALQLSQIDRLVANSAVDGVNLLASDSRTYRFQTTSVGGAVNVDPKPLDVKSLGLSNLTVISNTDIANALDSVSQALEVAKSRTADLAALGVNIAQAPDFLSQIVGQNFAQRAPTVRLPAGSILDLLA